MEKKQCSAGITSNTPSMPAKMPMDSASSIPIQKSSTSSAASVPIMDNKSE
eukprot:CAMPEP_0116048466 /NCGR_PEP_ID=MMETSP0321-20121206/29576_1 /TAXON_ID=163516 /ORGANISM="Leptocylindrus danicus var. danicus, Strain B650" /LENGTH=50 /DNA_ID=CAMNT_0003530687 /DNA_START=19 /DNA_END=168 /DNA_ORIENTATION=+